MLEALQSTEETLAGDQTRPAIELRSLSKTYGRGKKSFTAVKSLSVSIAPGVVFGFLGPNGAGKTTTIKMLAGLLLPTSGSAAVHGYDVQRQRSLAVQQIGAVLEGSRNIYWSLTAMQNLLYFGRLKGLRAVEIKPRAEQLLTELGLWDRRDQAVGGFSRGMQQKVAIAAALVTDPPVVLLDEPTIGLDVEASRTVRQWVVRLAREEGKTVVLTTHQLALAEELSDRVAVIRRGEIVADLPTEELLDRYAGNQLDVRLAAERDTVALTFPNGELEDAGPGQTSLLLPTEDQGALRSTLAKIGEAELPLVSVNRLRPSLEQVFLQITQEK
jgi:ABC-2 type transport system ATP-binding protein